MKFNKPKLTIYKRRIWLYDRGNFNTYRDILNNHNWDDLIQPDNIETTIKSLTDKITDAASKSIPNKLVTIRPNDIPWFNNSLRRTNKKTA